MNNLIRCTIALFTFPLLACGASEDGCSDEAGTICTWAGTGKMGFNGDGLARGATSFYWPMDLTFAADGGAWVADWNNHRIRFIDSEGLISSVLGNETIGDGPVLEGQDERSEPGVEGLAVNLNHPTGILLLPDGRTLVAAWHNHKLRRVDPASGRAFLFGGDEPGFDGDGLTARNARFAQPKSLARSPNGDIYVLDQLNQRIRRIRAETNVVFTVAGNGKKGFSGDGGPAGSASLSFPTGENSPPGGGLCFDRAGALFIADSENHRIRRVDLTIDRIETVAGDGTPGFAGDGGPAAAARLNNPVDLELGPDGNIYIADTGNHVIRKLDVETGMISTVAGNQTQAFSGDGGPATAASLDRPYGLAFDASGNLFIADTFNNRIRRVSAGG